MGNIDTNKDIIECGLFSTLGNLLKKLSKGLFRMFDKLVDYGLEIKDQKTTSNGGAEVTMESTDGRPIKFVITPTDNKESAGVVLVSIYVDGKKIKDLMSKEDDDEIMKNVINALKSEGIDVKASTDTKKFNISLKKVTAEDGYEVHLVAVNATSGIPYSDTKTTILSALDTMLSNDEFVDMITEDPQSFEVLEDDSNLEIESISGYDFNNACVSCLQSAVALYNNLKVIHWNAKGSHFFELHEKLDTYIDYALYDIDWLGELCVELMGAAPNPGILNSDYLITPEDGFTMEDGFRIVKSLIEGFVDCLDIYYANFNHDIQSQMDNSIRYWTKEMNYKLNQQQHV